MADRYVVAVDSLFTVEADSDIEAHQQLQRRLESGDIDWQTVEFTTVEVVDDG